MKDREVLEKYNNPTLFQFFPATNTKILLVGKPRSDVIIKNLPPNKNKNPASMKAKFR